MEYLIRLVQVHESFRVAELHALAQLASVDLQIIEYSPSVRPFFPPHNPSLSESDPRKSPHSASSASPPPPPPAASWSMAS